MRMPQKPTLPIVSRSSSRSINLLFIIAALMATLGVLLAGCAPGQTVTQIVTTTSTVPGTITSTLPPTTVTVTTSTTPPTTSTPAPGTVANGQRIFLTATSSSGEPIYAQGYMMMYRFISCADCHGQDGHGGTIFMMMFQIEVPNITWPVLTGPHQEHPSYTEETLKTAITQGLNPAGNPLSVYMPRWQMSSGDLNDLVSFIKTLN